jgi:hypothetical protein
MNGLDGCSTSRYPRPSTDEHEIISEPELIERENAPYNVLKDKSDV